MLKDAIRRYQKLIFLSAVYLNRDHVSNDIVDSLGETVPAPSPVTDPIESWSNDSISLKELLITVDRPDRCLYPQAGDDESYRLEIGRPTNGEGGNRSESIRLQATARIRSVSVWGALRALETFAQLVQVDGKREKLLVNATRIADWPAMSHRGILVDSSSHFIPLRTLLALLDAMEANKLNVLHWSVGGGSVSWPLISRATARLSLLGSFSPKHTYSRSDVFTLVERARMRGIRIVPELAVTGNAIALQRSFPHLIVCCSATDNHVDSTLDEPDTPDSVEDTLGDSLNDRFREHMAGTLTGDSTDDETIGNHVIDDIEDDSAATADHIHNKGFDRRRRRRRRQSPYELTASTLYAAESAAPDSQYPNRSVSIRSIRSSAPSSSSSSVLSSSASSSSASLPLSSEPIRSKHSNGEAGDDLESIEQCVLDPTRNGSFRLMQRVLREWRSQFVDEHVHVGLRRVRTDCWQQKPSVRRLMHALGVRSSIDLNHQFVVRLIEKAQSNRFKAIVWQDAFDQTFEVGPTFIIFETFAFCLYSLFFSFQFFIIVF